MLNADLSNELEDLIALAESPGYQRFKAMATEEWGSQAYRRKAQAIIKKTSEAGQIESAATHLLQLETSAQAVEGLFARLHDRIGQLRGKERNDVAEAR